MSRTVVPSHAAHVVQFYRQDEFLCRAVADYLAEGVALGQPFVVIATASHREGIEQQLAAKGINVDRLRASRTAWWCDARETLATVLVGASPDPERFTANVGRMLKSARGSNRRTTVRAYGEMVNLLWTDGNTDGAIQLEALWNGLARTQPFTLLCAYAMGNFADESHAGGFAQICQHHTHVMPTEDYPQADEETRLREISRLQQRAEALTAEVARREALEMQLRDALEREQAARTTAEAAARAKSDFLAVMSHELRTPLNAIGGYVQLIELGVHGDVTDAQREALARVQRSQRHLLSLINQVLDLARIEQQHLAYVNELVAVSAVVTDVCAMVDPLLRSKALTCAVAVPAGLTVRADPEKLQQILLNLLGNAIKFTPPGGHITVDATSTASPAAAHICLRDTGIGITVEGLHKIFAPFVQVSRDGEGTGLGLAISRGLARAMGGDLTAESTIGVGSTFTLSLPLAL